MFVPFLFKWGVFTKRCLSFFFLYIFEAGKANYPNLLARPGLIVKKLNNLYEILYWNLYAYYTLKKERKKKKLNTPESL